MVYASPIDLSSDVLFSNLSTNDTNDTKSPVRIFYKNIALDSITGPVPYVDLSISYNNTDAGMPLSVTTKATITGKLIRYPNSRDPDVTDAPGIGPSVVLSGINELKKLFSNNDGEFRLECGNNQIIKSYGPAKVNSFSSKPSSDNMVYSADYVIELEFNEPPITGFSEFKSYPLVKQANDSWSIESLEDYIYMNDKISTSGKIENHNPNLLPLAEPTNELKLVTLPRFKLSRKVSAVGLPFGSGSQFYPPAFYNAKKWIENQLSKSFNNPVLSGEPTISDKAISQLSHFTNLFLYNHLRSTNFDYLEATYEVNDTWLAMPSGVPYLEDYTIESSTDDKYVKTVRVKGTIEGLAISNLNYMKGSGLVPNDQSIIDLSYNTGNIQESFNITRLDKLDISTKTKTLYAHKYDNANSGWINDIKPFLYKRACAAINSYDRNQNYVPYEYDKQPTLNNPVYSYERLLNVIPISNTETHDPKKGSISYSYEYSNQLSLFSGVISESISIDHTGPTDIFNQAFVLGRKLGPVIQSLGAKTSSSKKLTIDLTVPVPTGLDGCFLSSSSCPLYTGGFVFKKMEELISGVTPFGARTDMFGSEKIRPAQDGKAYLKGDNITWNPAIGNFSRSIEWIYQYCNNNLTRSNLQEM